MLFNFNTSNYTDYVWHQQESLCSINEANENMIIKKWPDSDDYTYTIAATSRSLKLVPIPGYSTSNESNIILFEMKEKEKRWDFFRFSSLNQKKTSGEFDTRLMVVLKKPGFMVKERSPKFKVHLKSKNEKRSIDLRKKKKLSIKNSQELFADMLRKLDDVSDKETYSDDGIDFTPTIEKGTGDPKTYCFFFNFSDFEDEALKRKHQSFQNVMSITNTFGKISQCEIKGVINATRKDFFADIQEFMSEVTCSTDQVIIFVMSHGENGGFYTRDEFISEDDFHKSIKKILDNLDIAKILIHGYCQEINASLEHFYRIPSNTSSSSDDSDDCNISSFSDNRDGISVHNNVAENQKPIRYPNTLMGYAAKRGEKSFVGEYGSFYIEEMMEELERQMKLRHRVNLFDIISNVNSIIGSTDFDYNGKDVKQNPWSHGKLERGFWVTCKQDYTSVHGEDMRSLSVMHDGLRPSTSDELFVPVDDVRVIPSIPEEGSPLTVLETSLHANTIVGIPLISDGEKPSTCDEIRVPVQDIPGTHFIQKSFVNDATNDVY